MDGRRNNSGPSYTTGKFLEKAKEKHGDRYDYSLVDYTKSTTKVKIQCNAHGVFEQTPAQHLWGSGCPQCNRGSRKDGTRDKFVEKAIKIHGDRYDYSLVEYSGANVKVTIVCSIHGEFLQKPGSHVFGAGCPTCGAGGGERVDHLKSKEGFLIEARKTHGSKYNYSSVEYIHRRTEIKITCPEHGVFTLTPYDHCCGTGCAECGGVKRLTEAEFIRRAKETFDNRFDYSKVNYRSLKYKVTIGCPDHGWYEQIARNHLKGADCPKCGAVKRANNIRRTQDEFLTRAYQVHGNRYNYSKVKYQGADIPITIVCPLHGDFSQIPLFHTGGSNCPTCGRDNIKTALSLTQEEFIEKAKKVHRNKYSYSNTVYTGLKNKVTITCPKHGDYYSSAGNHLHGSGCPACNESRGERKVATTLDKVGIQFERQYRIPECRDKGVLPFDFYLNETGALIEFQGVHHYQPVHWNSAIGEEQAKALMKQVQKRDKIKQDYCEAHGIPLLVIPYWDKNNIESLINNFTEDSISLPRRYSNE